MSPNLFSFLTGWLKAFTVYLTFFALFCHGFPTKDFGNSRNSTSWNKALSTRRVSLFSTGLFEFDNSTLGLFERPLSFKLKPTGTKPMATSLVKRDETRPTKPRPTGTRPPHPLASHQPASPCGLRPATEENLEKDRVSFNKFVDETWEGFLWDDYYESFPMYIRDNYAEKIANSALWCDTIANCDYGTCLNIRTTLLTVASCLADSDMPEETRQNTLYMLEQIAGTVQIYKSTKAASEAATNYMARRVPLMVDLYSNVKDVDEAIKIRKNQEKALMGLFSSIGLLTSAGLGMGSALMDSWKIANAAFGIARATFESLSKTVADTRLDSDANNELDLKQSIANSFNEFSHIRTTSIDSNLRYLMGGGEVDGRLLNETLKAHSFLTHNPMFQETLREVNERWLFAGIVDIIWHFERTYIVWADAPGGCDLEWRGPWQNRVCLPEEPTSSFWLYGIGQEMENDKGGHKQGDVRGPTGFHDFEVCNRLGPTHDITLQDIVRSSLFVYRNKLEDAITNIDTWEIESVFNRENRKAGKGEPLGQIPGAFSIPICRNPGGEAISSVHTKASRNYPCMCGNFGWTDGRWRESLDETPDFLVKTGLMFSEDWEDYCSDNNKCFGANNIDLHSDLDSLRSKGDPPIPKQLKHNFKTCKKQWHNNPAGKPYMDYREDQAENCIVGHVL